MLPNATPVHKPFVSATDSPAEFTLKAIITGAVFGVLFGAATVYLSLKAGLSVSASIPIAVLAISLGRRFLNTTILENNIIQTTGSAGESIASGVVFTMPGFLFLTDSVSADFFNYWTILTLAILGGLVGTLMMIPLRRSLIVQEHETLPYPEGTACASVLIAGERGGDFAKTAYQGLGIALLYALLQKVLHVIAEVPVWATKQTNRYFPSAQVSGEITPEYLGVGYIIGFRISAVLVGGGILAWLGLIPLLASVVPGDTIALQLQKLGYLDSLQTAGGPGGWNPATHTFADTAAAIYRAYIRQIGAGAVTAGGFMTLIKTIPTIVSSFKQSFSGSGGATKSQATGTSVPRTEQDLSVRIVVIGSAVLVGLMVLLPQIPGDSILTKLLIAVLVIVFGFFFVTVASRIVGLIGSSSSPVSGMTIATIMGTSLVFIAFGLTGKVYEPAVLVVGSMICVAAANAGATSQDLKTGYLIGATPKYQQMALFIGVIVSSLVVGATVKVLDTPTPDLLAQGITHAIGSDKFPAPQGTLMATLIKGLLSFNLDWQFVLVGAFIAFVFELVGVSALAFAVGLYLPLSTTLPIFGGGLVKYIVDYNAKRRGTVEEDADLGKGNLFATGLVAGGALAGVAVALLSVNDSIYNALTSITLEPVLASALGTDGYMLLGALAFVGLASLLWRVATKR
ncbi:OPT family oligopeptide transporter [Spirosoma utsteinense]|uniref:OPT family oligopeptide transporter n=1 Tax=Spirosoma utsteinense TaxID=2585773 RepID=A0ABR6W2D9_9BACT|nr:OPT/YSL family transporter [Spirosoma utsteinense]MBC3784436.1 OPT family oligopeptide transporter [Spirosoma utsteinense]MBC3790763.1 OPT family oligopeptide transporter [Spirosoma utsteinense]